VVSARVCGEDEITGAQFYERRTQRADGRAGVVWIGGYYIATSRAGGRSGTLSRLIDMTYSDIMARVENG
jgi:hypothetical protein